MKLSKCPLCGEYCEPWLSSPVDPKTKEATNYGSASLCIKCDVGAIFPQPNSEEIAKFYDLKCYYTHGCSHFEHVKPAFSDKILIKFAWLLDRGRQVDLKTIRSKFESPGAACDLGCGAGHYLTELSAHGWEITGIEPDPKTRGLLTDRGLKVYPGTAEHLPQELQNRRFDLVIITHVLEHCLHPALALNNAAQLLKPGGLLLLEVPNKDCVHFRTFGAASECYDAPRHLFFFGAAGLRRLVQKQSLNVEEEYHHGLTRHHLPDWRATETAIRAAMIALGASEPPPPHTRLRSFLLLLQELLSPPEQRYDTIGLWARKPVESNCDNVAAFETPIASSQRMQM